MLKAEIVRILAEHRSVEAYGKVLPKEVERQERFLNRETKVRLLDWAESLTAPTEAKREEARTALRASAVKPGRRGAVVDLARRAEVFAPGTNHPCYGGQWTVHPAHSYEVHVQNWLGGGTETVTCHGVAEGETLPERHARNAEARAAR